MIEKETIDHIKTSVDIKDLVESKGIKLKKNGQSWFGLCPFHNDKTPSLSVTPSKNQWHCFGCDKGGDVIRFVELFDQVDFKEAVKRLTQGTLSQGSLSFNRPEQASNRPMPSNTQKYLERVAAIYEDNFGKKETAINYLESRGITDAGLFTMYGIGFCDNTLDKILPSNGGVKEDLKQAGILLENGSERFKDCVVFPVHDLDGHVVTLYGRHIITKKHLFLPNRPTGLWNINIIKTCSHIILTESVIDALSVRMAGLANVISIQGVNGLDDQAIMDFKNYGVQRITLLMDADPAGATAAKQLKEKLSEFEVDIKVLPDGHDPNSYLMEHGPQTFGKFIQYESREATSIPDQAVLEQALPAMQGLVIPCGVRQYQVMGLDKKPNKLKATIRLEHGGKLHIDSLDLYQARARNKLASDLCQKFEQMPETIESDITRIIHECENIKDDPSDQPKIPEPVITNKEKKQALAFGRSKNLVELILSDFKACGLIGEQANKLLGYIAMTSRKRPQPLSVQILSSSGAGKTALQDAVVEFCPPEDLVKLTSLSGKALFYKEQASLKHKILALEEGDGAEDASYAIRCLISSGVLINETTVKDLATGKLTTMENRVEGPTAVFYTTTNPDVDPETKSRFFVTGIDESREQTRRILAFQREMHLDDDITEKTRVVIQKHHTFQRLLKPLGVKNPYSSQLTYGDDRLQGRRDQPKYLNLIKSVAFLRQMQKQVQGNYIEVDIEDISIANDLAKEILGRSLDELSRPGRDLLMLLDEMVEQRWQKTHKKDRVKRTDIGFTRRDIREYTGWSNTRVHRYLKELADLEYVLVDSGRNGSRYHYRLAYEGQGRQGEKFVLGLTSVEQLIADS